MRTDRVPGLGIVAGHAGSPSARCCSPRSRCSTPRSSTTSRRAIAAASSSSTTRPARSSARPASSARRPVPSNASTWAAWTRATATTSTGARPSSTPSAARRARCAARDGPSRTARSTPFEPIDLAAARRHPRRRGLPAAPRRRHPGADAGGLRTPARGRAPAHRPPDRRLVQRAVRHRHLVPAPALRAADGPRRARLPLPAVHAAGRRTRPGRLPRAPRHRRRRRQPRRRRAPRDDRLRRRIGGQRAGRGRRRRCCRAPAAEDAATIAAALRADVPQGRPA